MIKRCIVLFALLIVSLELETQAEEFTLLKKSFWGQAWESSEGVFLSQLDQLYYATPNKQGYSFESRLKVGVSVTKDMGAHFGYDVNGRVWGLMPKEASTWIDIRSAYIEWHNLQKTNLFVKVGRVLPNWGGMDEYSPIKEIFPKLVIDPLESRSNGIIGLYGRIEEETLDFEALGSPLFIPNLGGALYETDTSGKFYSPSRWAMPLYDTATVGKAAVPLDYKIHLPQRPADIASVIFKLGGGVRITLRDFYDQYRFSALMMHAMDPDGRMEIQGKLTTGTSTKNNTLTGQVDLYPRFFRHTVYALEGNIQGSRVDLHMESAYRIPDNSQDLSEYMIKPIEWKNFFAFQTKNEISFLPQVLLGLVLTRQFDPYQDPSYKIPSRSLNNVVGKLYWKPLSKLSAFSASEVALSLKEGIWKNGIEWTPLNHLNISTGIDLIMGQSDTYWGFLRHQDRLWLRGTYAF